jgi:hypothetical protein
LHQKKKKKLGTTGPSAPKSAYLSNPPQAIGHNLVPPHESEGAGNDLEKLFQKDYFEKFHTQQRESDTHSSRSTSNMQTTPRQGKGQMVSKPPPPLSIEVEEDARGGKSLMYKPEKMGSGLQTYSSQATKTRPGKSPITLQLTEIIEKFKPSFVEESHDQQESPNPIEEGGPTHLDPHQNNKDISPNPQSEANASELID